MAVSLSSLLPLLFILLAVFIYFHLECMREREERLRNKFNAQYHPEQRDCEGEIEFFKTETGQVSVWLGKTDEVVSLTTLSVIAL